MAPLLSMLRCVLPAVLMLSAAAAPLYTPAGGTSAILQMDAHYVVQRRVKRFLANSSNDATSSALKEMLKQKLHLLLRQITVPEDIAPLTATEDPLTEKESHERRQVDEGTTPGPRYSEREYRNKEGGYKKTEQKKHRQPHSQQKTTENRLQYSDICFLKQLKTKFPKSDSATLIQLLLKQLKTDSAKDDPCDEDVSQVVDRGREDSQREAASEGKQLVDAPNPDRGDEGITKAQLRIRLVIDLPLEEVLTAVRQQATAAIATALGDIHQTHDNGDNDDSLTDLKKAANAWPNPKIDSENPSNNPPHKVKISLPGDKHLNTEQFQVDMEIVDSNKQNVTMSPRRNNESNVNEIEELLKLFLVTMNNKTVLKSYQTIKNINENSKNFINHRSKRSIDPNKRQKLNRLLYNLALPSKSRKLQKIHVNNQQDVIEYRKMYLIDIVKKLLHIITEIKAINSLKRQRNHLQLMAYKLRPMRGSENLSFMNVRRSKRRKLSVNVSEVDTP